MCLGWPLRARFFLWDLLSAAHVYGNVRKHGPAASAASSFRPSSSTTGKPSNANHRDLKAQHVTATCKTLSVGKSQGLGLRVYRSTKYAAPSPSVWNGSARENHYVIENLGFQWSIGKEGMFHSKGIFLGENYQLL